MNNIDLTPIIQALIALMAALITCRLIPWIRSKTTESQQRTMEAAAKVAVYAAEQIFGAGHGEDKFEYAAASIRRAGFDIDMDRISDMIEQAVLELDMAWTQNYEKLQPPGLSEPEEDRAIQG